MTAMSQTKALKVRVTLFCILVGIVLALVAVVTDHWAVLSPHVEHLNATCEAAHFGLWRICTKRIAVGDSKDKSCGPITLPGGNVPLPVPPPTSCPFLSPKKAAHGREGRGPCLGTQLRPAPRAQGEGFEVYIAVLGARARS